MITLYLKSMIPSNLTGKRLQAWRESRGWSRSYVAGKIGRHSGFIWKMEVITDVVPMYAAILFSAVDKGIGPLE